MTTTTAPRLVRGVSVSSLLELADRFSCMGRMDLAERAVRLACELADRQANDEAILAETADRIYDQLQEART